MQRGKCLFWMVAAALLNATSGCTELASDRAQTWVAKQDVKLMKSTLPPVPEIIDTPPAIYTGNAEDAFSPERLSAARGVKAGSRQGGVIFPESAESALVIMGFLSGGDQERLAIVRSGSQYRTVRKGDRIGELASEVMDIQDKGLLVSSEDQGPHWLLRPS